MSSSVPASQVFAERRILGEPRLHTDGEVLQVAFDAEGNLLSLEEPGVLRRWNPERGQALDWTALSEVETAWAFSRDGRVLASACDDATIWDASSGSALTVFAQPSWVTALAFAHDPAFLATGHDDGTIRYWDAAAHHLVFDAPFRQHVNAISALAVSPNGKILAAASEDKHISLWSLRDGALLGVLEGHTDRIPAVAWHADGRHLVSAGWDTTARVWDVQTLEPVILLNNHGAQVFALAFSPDGDLLATADCNGTIHLWDFASKKELRVLRGPQSEIRSLAFSPDGRRLACNGERMIHLWDAHSGRPCLGHHPRIDARTSIAVGADNRNVVSNGAGHDVHIVDFGSRENDARSLEEADAVHSVAWSPDGRWIAGAAGETVQLWKADTGKLAGRCEGPSEPISLVAFSPDSEHLASAGREGFGVWIWRVADREPVLLIPYALDGCAIHALAFHPDGRRLIVGGIDHLATGGSTGAVSVWDLPARAEIALFGAGTTALAPHPAGSLLAVANLDETIGIWNLDEQELQAELTGHEASVTCLAYSPSGYLASGAADQTLRLWGPDGAQIDCVELESQATGLCFAPDGEFLYVAHANTTCSQIRLAPVGTC